MMSPVLAAIVWGISALLVAALIWWAP
jgi:hypothetical protein